MVVVIVIFALLSMFYYDYKYYTGEETGEDEFEDDEVTSIALRKDARAMSNGGYANKGYDNDLWDERL